MVRWHRGGYYPVAERIKTALPRYRDLDDGAAQRRSRDQLEHSLNSSARTWWQSTHRVQHVYQKPPERDEFVRALGELVVTERRLMATGTHWRCPTP